MARLTDLTESVAQRQALQKFQVAVRRHLPSRGLTMSSLEFSSYFDYEIDALVLQLKGYLAGSEPSVYKQSMSVPTTWWDHFKHQHRNNRAIRWLLKRGWMKPPRFTEWEFSAEGRLLFPDVKAWFRNEQRHFEVVRTELTKLK